MARKRKPKAVQRQASKLSLAIGLIVLVAVLGGTLWYLQSTPEERQRLSERVEERIEDLKGFRRTETIQPHQERFYGYAGLPRTTTYPYPITVLTNQGFIVGYCEHRKNPLWTSYRVFRLAGEKSPPRPSHFSVDTRTSSRVRHDDYTNSGYDRGHLAPNYAIATRYGEGAQIETFLMSNISPQKPALNQNLWHRLEEKVAVEYALNFEELWVITGTVFDNRIEKLKSGVEIPDAFFKIILDEDGDYPRVLAFLAFQTLTGKEQISELLVSVDKIEDLTGLDVLWGLDDSIEIALEAYEPNGVW